MTTTGSEKTIFITGGTGFLGRAIVANLQEAHPTWKLISYDLNLPADDDVLPGIQYVQGDILSLSAVQAALHEASPDAVIHTAGIVTPMDQRYSKKLRPLVHKINIEGTRIVLDASQATPSVTAFVWTGSCCAVIDDFRYQYPNVDETWATSPNEHNTVYGESKAIAEAEVLAANDPDGSKTQGKKLPFLTCSLRPSTLFGDSDSPLLIGIHDMIARHETPFVIGEGNNLWDVCHASNIADAHVLAVENLLIGNKRAAGEAFFIGNDEFTTFRDFCLAVWREFGHVPPFELAIPQGLAWVVGWILEWVSWLTGTVPSMRRESVGDATAVRYANPAKAREILGYRARLSLEEGIGRSCRLYKKRLEERAKQPVEHRKQK